MAKILNHDKFHTLLERGVRDEGGIPQLTQATGNPYATVLAHINAGDSNEPLTGINGKVLARYYMYFGEEILEAVKKPENLELPEREKVEVLQSEDNEEEQQNILYEIIARLARIEAKVDQILTNQEKDLWVS